MTDRDQMHDWSALQPGEVVEVYVQPLPGEVIETYCQPGPLPGQKSPAAVPAAEEAAPNRPEPRRKKRRKGLWICLAVAAVLLLAGLAAAAGWLLGRQRSLPPSDYGNYYEYYDDTESLEEITIPGYPWGQGASVTMCAERGRELTAQEIYAKVNPSVVTVMVWLRDGASVGTGVILTEDGYILTNHHVLAGGSQCQVALDTGMTYDASYVAGDSVNDIAVLKVEAQDLPAAEIGDSDMLVVGDKVYAIGNPLGTELRGTFTDGIVSAINRDVEVDGRTMTLIQTNAALNNGNSGGPLINVYGQVVGINTIKMSSSYSTIEGLGFALPTASVTYLVNDLLSCGEIQPEPRIGVMVSMLPVTLEDGNQGIEVWEVTKGTPADLAGIQEGDVIVSAGGQPITSSHALLRVRRGMELGDELTVTLWRNGAYLELTLYLTMAAE